MLLIRYYLGNEIRKNEMGRACNTCGERRGAWRVLMGKPKGKRPLGRPRRRWENNNKRDIQEVDWEREQDQSGS